jgi:hypothetical protein
MRYENKQKTKGEHMNDFNEFLPARIRPPTLPEKWDCSAASERINQKHKRIKTDIRDSIIDLWVSHEMIVKKKIKGETWKAFVETVPFSDMTIYRAFERFNLPITKVTHKAKELSSDSSQKPEEIQTPKKVLSALKNLSEAIAENKVASKDLQDLNVIQAKEIRAGNIDPVVAVPVKNAVTETTGKKGNDKDTRTDLFKLERSLSKLTSDLDFLIDGDDRYQPRSKDDKNALEAIRIKMVSFVWHAFNLGIDVLKVYETLIQPKRGKHDSSSQFKKRVQDHRENIIEVEFKKVVK